MDAAASWTWLTDVFEPISSGRRQARGIFFVSSLFWLGSPTVAKWVDRVI